MSGGAVVGAAAGLAWLAAAAFLGLISMVAAYFSLVGFVIVAAWAIAAAAIGFRLLQAPRAARIHAISSIAGGSSASIAAWFALTSQGSELLWSVVALAGIAGIYSLVAIRRARIGATGP